MNSSQCRSAQWTSVHVGLVLLILVGCVGVPIHTLEEPIPPPSSASPQVVAAYHLVEEGREQLARGETGSAVATFQKALALAPSSPHASLALGEAKLKQADYRAALVYFDRVSNLTGDNPDWAFRLALLRGQAHEGAGNASQARADYQTALRLVPHSPEAEAALARLDSQSDLP